MIYKVFIIVSLLAFLMAIFSFPFFITIFSNFGFLDRPTAIKNHTKATPYGGGVVLFFLGVFLVSFFEYYLEKRISLAGHFILSVMPFFLIGFLDDLFKVSPIVKTCFLLISIYLFFVVLGLFSLPFLYLFIIAFLITLLSNSFNLIDVSDGLLGFTVVPALMFFVLLGFNQFFCGYALISAVFLGLVLGFLVFNTSPAKIFLGECGAFGLASIFIFLVTGFIKLFGLSFKSSIIVLVLFGVPLAEVVALIFIRSFKRIAFYNPSPHHFKHYLASQGLTQGDIAGLSFTASSVLCTTAALLFFDKITSLAVVFVAVIGFVAWCFLIYHPSQPVKQLFKLLED